MKLTPLIPKPRFWTCICQFLQRLFLPKFMINFHFENCQFPILDGDVHRSTSSGVSISQHILFARASNYVADFNTRIKLFTQKLLNNAIGIINFTKPFLNFIDNTLICYLNSKLDLNVSCAKDCCLLLSLYLCFISFLYFFLYIFILDPQLN